MTARAKPSHSSQLKRRSFIRTSVGAHGMRPYRIIGCGKCSGPAAKLATVWAPQSSRVDGVQHNLGGWMRLSRALSRVLFLAALPLFAQTLEIHYIDVGWGGSVFIKGPTGVTVLLEGGNTGMGTQYVVPYLKSIGVQPANGLDYIIAGHQHCDHTGGLDEVIQAGYNVQIKQYYN